ncbi:uncharacterized protein LOC106089109 [Stomoxys calcitrans]|uniref:uncharacterized protein LOC106089109 n=1 Tax=Stomoxys calcitrans TaxID=35570 RepID=UPI0027E30545|nr:uncharacterized protein LOC106089109 [Stomoxys calcitrans]
MKITLAVLFLAILTIYCKCMAVLSLPPSLIARAASLEATQTPKAALVKSLNKAREGGEGGSESGNAAILAQGERGSTGNIVQGSVLLKNLKNLWPKNFALHKRERLAFEDAIAAPLLQPMAAIKNNKNALQQPPRHDQHHEQPYDIGNNNFLKMESSASNFKHHPTATAVGGEKEDDDLEAADDEEEAENYHDASAEEQYDSNEWLNPNSHKMTDDMAIVSPANRQHFFADIEAEEESADDDDDEDPDDDDDDEAAAGAYAFPPSFANTDLDTKPDTDAKDNVGSMVWNKFLRPLKYSTNKACQTANENCPEEEVDYYRGGLNVNRNLNYPSQKFGYSAEVSPRPNLLSSSEVVPKTSQLPTFQSENIHNVNNDDILLLLTAEQNLVQFLNWAMHELYPFEKFANVSEHGADHYHPGMFSWKKLNLSGRLEPPMYVEEPHYVIVRREYDADDDLKRGLHSRDDPFIPPRGRKHNLPDLDSLLQRYETFVPNRGRRDNIKDIFKYDDLFYPNRGKRQMRLPQQQQQLHKTIGDIVGAGEDIKEANHHQQQQQFLMNEENAAIAANHHNPTQQQQQLPALSWKALEQLENVMAKMRRKLHQMQQQQNTFDEMSDNNNIATKRMSTSHQPLMLAMGQKRRRNVDKRLKSIANIFQQRRQQLSANSHKNLNARRQWLKRYAMANSHDRPTAKSGNAGTTTATTSNSGPSHLAVAANRLHALRSMSPLQHHRQQQPHQQDLVNHGYLSSTKYAAHIPNLLPMQQQTSPLQRQSLAARQFDPLSWHKLQMLQHQYHLPLLTMRHSRLTPAVEQQQQLQHPFTGEQQQRQNQAMLPTPQETQLSWQSSDAMDDNAMANDLGNLFKTDYD